MKLAIFDLLGLTYDDRTVENYGLGGSESAVIYMSRELSALGIEVTVFNNCNDSRAAEGVYSGVRYVDINRLRQPLAFEEKHPALDETFDVVISSRSILPFAPEGEPVFGIDIPSFQNIVRKAKHKILWLHDTFCEGDQHLERYLVSGFIDEVFTLSDFHTTYFSFCDHGNKRNPEVLKSKIFITRNGMKKRIDWVNINEKDPDLFVYNASVTKGLIPLLEVIWPSVKMNIPNARLVVIGGYYRFRDGAPPDEQEKTLKELQDRYQNDPSVTFTGVISQTEIANIVAKASFMLYPGAFPETFGISSLESLAYNTPIITTRFGALEETAIQDACYLIDYAIEPNSLYPNIDKQQQASRFIEMTVLAHANKYQTYQKMHACNIVQDIAGWDSVAIQWKQHLFRKLGWYLPVEEFRKASRINHRVHQVFGRRFSNPEEWEYQKPTEEPHLIIVTPFFNARDYIQRCITSIATQDYQNFTHLLIDDASTDDTVRIVEETLAKLPNRENFKLIKNEKNVGAVANQIINLQAEIAERGTDAVVLLVDGDDALVNNNTILRLYGALYENGETEFTYGSMWSMVDSIALVAQPYPPHVKEQRSYRSHFFPWIMPYTHLRTFHLSLLKGVPDSAFQNSEGEWYRAGGDNAIFFTLIERAAPEKVKHINDIIYLYNDMNPANDYKINNEEQKRNAREILNMKSEADATISLKSLQPKAKSPASKIRILLGIPYSRYTEPECEESINNLIIPDNVELRVRRYHGYLIDQIRNLIADHAIRGGDYLFAVDSDIILPPDALVKLLKHDVDVVSGVYIQRKEGQEIPEIFVYNNRNGVDHIKISKLKEPQLAEVAACGFGCVLVKSEVLKKIGYPQFVYQSALTEEATISEDTWFCQNAIAAGYKVWVDTTVVCGHVGKKIFYPTYKDIDSPTVARFKELRSQDLLPRPHKDYLQKLKDGGVEPKVIYDIGSCVLHWYDSAKRVWPSADIVAFDAMSELTEYYGGLGIPYCVGVLSAPGVESVEFYSNPEHPGGNSYFKENPELSPLGEKLFPSPKKQPAKTLDQVVSMFNFPPPDMIKMDVQGAEMDILKGATETLKSCTHLILELQTQEYNIGAPMAGEVIAYLKTCGFELVSDNFSRNMADGDYHFKRAVPKKVRKKPATKKKTNRKKKTA